MWYLSKAEVNLIFILSESIDLPSLFAARTKIIYVVSVLIWTLHKHNLASNFLLSLSCFRNTKWKCLVTRSPTQTGSMAMPVTKRWEKLSSDQSQNILALEMDILSAANVKLGWQRVWWNASIMLRSNELTTLAPHCQMSPTSTLDLVNLWFLFWLIFLSASSLQTIKSLFITNVTVLSPPLSSQAHRIQNNNITISGWKEHEAGGYWGRRQGDGKKEEGGGHYAESGEGIIY